MLNGYPPEVEILQVHWESVISMFSCCTLPTLKVETLYVQMCFGFVLFAQSI